jgi:hypothetical protein
MLIFFSTRSILKPTGVFIVITYACLSSLRRRDLCQLFWYFRYGNPETRMSTLEKTPRYGWKVVHSTVGREIAFHFVSFFSLSLSLFRILQTVPLLSSVTSTRTPPPTAAWSLLFLLAAAHLLLPPPPLLLIPLPLLLLSLTTNCPLKKNAILSLELPFWTCTTSITAGKAWRYCIRTLNILLFHEVGSCPG